MKIDIFKDVIGEGKNKKKIYLRDIWPTNKEIENTLKKALSAEMFVKRYSNVSDGPIQWQKIKTESCYLQMGRGFYLCKNHPFLKTYLKSLRVLKKKRQDRY